VLTAELQDSGLATTLITPGATDTTLWDSVDRRSYPGLPEPSSMLRPAAVAGMVLEAVTRAMA
jgi:short-subunit dehydrogenase